MAGWRETGARHRYSRRLAVAAGAGLLHRHPGQETGRSGAVLPRRPGGRSGRRSGRITPCNRYRRVICRVCHFRGPSHPVHGPESAIMAMPRNERLTCNVPEPPIGIEPMTYALRETRSLAMDALAAPIAQEIAPTALAALGLSRDPVHEPVHARALGPRHPSTVSAFSVGDRGRPSLVFAQEASESGNPGPREERTAFLTAL
jgi:hypothetical protein